MDVCLALESIGFIVLSLQFLRLNPSFPLYLSPTIFVYTDCQWVYSDFYCIFSQIVFHHHWSEYNCVRGCLHHLDLGYVNGACLWVDHDVLVLPVDCPADRFLSHVFNKVWVVEWITIFDEFLAYLFNCPWLEPLFLALDPDCKAPIFRWGLGIVYPISFIVLHYHSKIRVRVKLDLYCLYWM